VQRVSITNHNARYVKIQSRITCIILYYFFNFMLVNIAKKMKKNKKSYLTVVLLSKESKGCNLGIGDPSQEEHKGHFLVCYTGMCGCNR